MAKKKPVEDVAEKEVEQQPKKLLVDPYEVKLNDIMAFTYIGEVKQRRGFPFEAPDQVNLSLSGVGGSPDFDVNGNVLIEHASSADFFVKTEKVGKLDAAELLSTAYGRVFTVKFVKQDGQDRVLRGCLIHSEPLLGRSQVRDLDIREGDARRLVDHRTIEYLILDNVKYVVTKGK